ncbi:MAG: hypothetical protein WBA12_04145 [Catalinimonas sp.]
MLRHLYEETDADEGALIEAHMAHDADLYREWEETRALQKQLDAAALEPPARMVDAILAYAQKSAPQREQIG